LLPKLLTVTRRAAVLPNNCIVERLTRGFVPQQASFALHRQPDRRNLARLNARRLDRRLHDGAGVLPDFDRVML
jgi:hypothetical protein